MTLVDVNLLIYATNRSAPEHAAAFEWLSEQLDSSRVGLPWASLLAFLRIATNTRAFAKPLTIDDAWDQVRIWLGYPGAWIPHPAENHVRILEQTLKAAPTGGNLVPDAHLAALAIEHGLILCSTDADFARFDGLKWHNPLNPKGGAKRV